MQTKSNIRCLIAIDVESDGPVPGMDMFSMVSFGAVIVEPGLNRTFFGRTAPISERWLPEALAISGITREEHLAYPAPFKAICAFDAWLRRECPERPQMISDNPAFDFSFMSYYLWRYVGENYLGHSGRRLNDLYAGWQETASATQGWKKYRTTKHTHHPVDDARGMAEALLELKAHGLRIDMIPEKPRPYLMVSINGKRAIPFYKHQDGMFCSDPDDDGFYFALSSDFKAAYIQPWYAYHICDPDCLPCEVIDDHA